MRGIEDSPVTRNSRVLGFRDSRPKVFGILKRDSGIRDSEWDSGFGIRPGFWDSKWDSGFESFGIPGFEFRDSGI